MTSFSPYAKLSRHLVGSRVYIEQILGNLTLEVNWLAVRRHLFVAATGTVIVAATTITWWMGDRTTKVNGPTATLAATAAAAAAERSYVAVTIQGDRVGYVASGEQVDAAVAAITAQLPSEAKALVDVGSAIQRVPVQLSGPVTLLNPLDLEHQVRTRLPLPVQAWSVSVNGRNIVAVSSRAEAEQVIAAIQDEYQRQLAEQGAAVEQVRILESIAFRERWVPPGQVRTTREAHDILRFGTDKLVFYTVQRGDTLWDIASNRGLSVEDLQKANPGMQPELIQPGQQISMTVKEPNVHLESSETQVYTESIPFPVDVETDPNLWPWQWRVVKPGRPGAQRMTVRINRKDGQEVGRETLNVEVLSQPVRQLSVRGSRMASERGTGQFDWPVPGEITSEFGARWGGWHPGIDIGAPTGTPIHAADSGTVTYADWGGNYGLQVQIDHGQGKMVTVYGHMSRIGVELGQEVEKGQVIGYVGSTGYSTGPHLHFEVRIDGRAVEPLRFYP